MSTIGPRYPRPKSHEYVEHIKQLVRDECYDEAEILLENILEDEEEWSQKSGHGVAPWYYWELAVIYRKRKRIDDEIAVLERYDRQKKARGSRPAKLKDRLQKAYEIKQRGNA